MCCYASKVLLGSFEIENHLIIWYTLCLVLLGTFYLTEVHEYIGAGFFLESYSILVYFLSGKRDTLQFLSPLLVYTLLLWKCLLIFTTFWWIKIFLKGKDAMTKRGKEWTWTLFFFLKSCVFTLSRRVYIKSYCKYMSPFFFIFVLCFFWFCLVFNT